jgi:hypothetical protein
MGVEYVLGRNGYKKNIQDFLSPTTGPNPSIPSCGVLAISVVASERQISHLAK